jgi:iron complex transport system substrate-binding protein
MGRVALAAAAAALLVGATACGERHEPTGSAVPLYPITVTDGADHPVAMKQAPERIATLTPSAVRILDALGLGKRVVDPAQGYFGTQGQLLIARLRKARPELVIASTNQTSLARSLTEVKAPVYFAPENSLDEVERSIVQLGLLTGRPVAARQLVHALEQQQAAVRAKVAKEKRVKVFVDKGFFITISDQSLGADLIRQAQGRNVAGRNPPSGPFQLADLVRLNPDVYLATADSGTTLAQLRKNKLTRKIAAVRKGRFYVIEASLLEPGPKIGAALETIARLLHPDAFR